MKNIISFFIVALCLISCNNMNNSKQAAVQSDATTSETAVTDSAFTVHLYYTGKNGSAKKFVEEMISSGTLEKIRAIEGNLQYEYFYSVDDPETVLLIDSWTGQAAINRHHSSPMMQTIIELREKYEITSRREFYSPNAQTRQELSRFTNLDTPTRESE